MPCLSLRSARTTLPQDFPDTSSRPLSDLVIEGNARMLLCLVFCVIGNGAAGSIPFIAKVWEFKKKKSSDACLLGMAEKWGPRTCKEASGIENIILLTVSPSNPDPCLGEHISDTLFGWIFFTWNCRSSVTERSKWYLMSMCSVCAWYMVFLLSSPWYSDCRTVPRILLA